MESAIRKSQILMRLVAIACISLTLVTSAWAADFNKGLKAYRNSDYITAFQEWQPLAEQGNATAQYNLGFMYDNGEGVTQDKAKAVEWYTEAAQQGYANAQYNLGSMYSNGEGVAQDKAKAVEWYTEAAQQGFARAQTNLGFMYSNGEGVAQDKAKAVEWYTEAAQQGYERAQFNLGFMYDNGEGVAQDKAKAVRWYTEAAQQGYASAQTNLGFMYDNGEGVAQDKAKAVRWYTEAAQQGFARAQANLGFMYSNGEGVAQDKAKAVRWYTEAAQQGYERAQFNLEKLLNETRKTVGVTTANVREEPAISAQVAFQLNSGDLVHSLNKNGAWHQIYVSDIGEFGWIHQSTLSYSQASSASSGRVELFGAPLKTVTRQVMRQTLAKTNVKVIREDNNYWIDTYNPDSELNGANQFDTGYTDAGKLAYAQYRFPSHMDKDQVTQIAKMVATKYEDWETIDGNPNLGSVEYRWDIDGVIIRVFRGWPNTTTFLKYEIPGNLRTMQAEIDAADKIKKEREAQNQTNAF